MTTLMIRKTFNRVKIFLRECFFKLFQYTLASLKFKAKLFSFKVPFHYLLKHATTKKDIKKQGDIYRLQFILRKPAVVNAGKN